MSARNELLESPAAQSAASVLTVVRKKAGGFTKVSDSRGEVEGLWKRNGRFYCQFSLPGKGCRRVALLDERNRAVETVAQAVDAMHELLKKKRQGELPISRRAPHFDEYVAQYLAFIQATGKKKPKTIVQEESILKRWAKYLGGTRLTQITRQRINDYVLQR